MKYFAGGLDESGMPKPMSYEALKEVTETWVRTAATPEHISSMLQTTRDLFVHSYYEYEFLVVATVWSMLAVEEALRSRLGVSSSVPLQELMRRAVNKGFLEHEWAERFKAMRYLRNSLAHGKAHQNWSFGMASQVIETNLAVVGLLFGDDG